MRPTISSWDTNRLSNLLFDLLLAIAFAIIMPREARPTISFFFTCWPGSKRSPWPWAEAQPIILLFIFLLAFSFLYCGQQDEKKRSGAKEKDSHRLTVIFFFIFLFIIVSADTRKERKRIDDCAGDSCLSFTMGTSFHFGRAFECVLRHMSIRSSKWKEYVPRPAGRSWRPFFLLLRARLCAQSSIGTQKKEKEREFLMKENIWSPPNNEKKHVAIVFSSSRNSSSRH